MEISLEDIKKFNEEIREIQERKNRLQAELDVNKDSLMRLCKEISEELGREVTPNNVKEVYTELVQSIQSNLQNGRDILDRIKRGDIKDTEVTEIYKSEEIRETEVNRGTLDFTEEKDSEKNNAQDNGFNLLF